MTNPETDDSQTNPPNNPENADTPKMATDIPDKVEAQAQKESNDKSKKHKKDESSTKSNQKKELCDKFNDAN